jgi:hypothetical protein
MLTFRELCLLHAFCLETKVANVDPLIREVCLVEYFDEPVALGCN